MDRTTLPPQVHQQSPSGQVIVIFAFFLVVLMGCIALGVDAARLQVEAIKVQKAADEAALAAVAQASNGDTMLANSTANNMVRANLPPGASVSISATLTISPVQQVHVTVQETGFPLFFAPVLGLHSAVVTRQATAQYNAPVPMGNPSNTLGDPSSTIATLLPDGTISTTLAQNMSLAINGPDEWSESGDPYSPLYVLSDPPVAAVSGSQLITNSLRSEASPQFNGYDYEVTIPTTTITSEATYIQVYDAETCMDTSVAGQTPFEYYTPSLYGVPWTNQRLQDPNNISSASVAAVTGSAHSYSPQTTYYSLSYINPSTGQRAPIFGDSTDPPDPNVLANGRTADPHQLPPSSSIGDVIIAPGNGSKTSSSNSCDPAFLNKWYTLAKVQTPTNGTGSQYIVNVNTCLTGDAVDPLNSSNPPITYDPYANSANHRYDYSNQYWMTNNGVGHNEMYNCIGSEVNTFAIRAVTVDDTSTSNICYGLSNLNCQSFITDTTQSVPYDHNGALINNQPEVAGLGRISLTNRVAGTGQTLIYLAKVNSIYAGKYLMVKMYDPGDLHDASSVQIVMPNGQYAPFTWYTETLDGNGTPFTTSISKYSSTSLITSYSRTGGVTVFTSVPTNTVIPTVTVTLTSTPTPADTLTPTNTSTATSTANDTSTVTDTPTDTPTPLVCVPAQWGQTSTDSSTGSIYTVTRPTILTKTGGYTWPGGGESQSAIVTGPGAFEFRLNQTITRAEVGLMAESGLSLNSNLYQTMPFGIYFDYNGTASIMEGNSTLLSVPGGYTTSPAKEGKDEVNASSFQAANWA